MTAPSRMVLERALRRSPLFWASGRRGFGLQACRGAEGSVALGSSSPSCSPPVLLFPACSTALVKPCPRLHCRTPVPQPCSCPWAVWGKVPGPRLTAAPHLEQALGSASS